MLQEPTSNKVCHPHSLAVCALCWSVFIIYFVCSTIFPPTSWLSPHTWPTTLIFYTGAWIGSLGSDDDDDDGPEAEGEWATFFMQWTAHNSTHNNSRSSRDKSSDEKEKDSSHKYRNYHSFPAIPFLPSPFHFTNTLYFSFCCSTFSFQLQFELCVINFYFF